MNTDNLESQPLIKAEKKDPTGFRGYSLTDLMAMFFILCLGMGIFCGMFVLASFKMHYRHAEVDYMIMTLCGGLVAWFCWTAVRRMLMTADGATDHFGVWALTLAVASLAAFFGGIMTGWKNYVLYMQPYYETVEMNSYRDVDPSTMDGGAFMDAGSIKFTPGSHLDVSKSIGFMNLDMYCVAPIVSKTPVRHWDFWAVGVNCCSGAPNNFACGSAVAKGTQGRLGDADSGLRLMSVSELPFYQMAVQQAVSRYLINSTRPIFFHWVEDAKESTEDYRNHGWAHFYFSCVAAFGSLLLIVGAGGLMAVLVKSKYK